MDQYNLVEDGKQAELIALSSHQQLELPCLVSFCLESYQEGAFGNVASVSTLN